MKYQNSKQIILLLYFAVGFFPLLAITCGYFLLDSYHETDYEQMTMMFIGTLFFIYVSIIGFKFFKFIKLEYELSDEGIHISGKKGGNNGTVFYPWTESMRFKTSDSLQLFWLYDDNGQSIAVVDYMMPGYAEFSDFIATKVTRK